MIVSNRQQIMIIPAADSHFQAIVPYKHINLLQVSHWSHTLSFQVHYDVQPAKDVLDKHLHIEFPALAI